MSFGPACERCGANSYEGSMDDQPPRCPFCGKPKRRGSRAELVKALNDAKHSLISAVGFLAGASLLDLETMKDRLVQQVKAIEDV